MPGSPRNVSVDLHLQFFQGFYAAGVSKLELSQIKTLITDVNIVYISGNASKGFTKAELSHFALPACGHLSEVHMANILPESYPGFTPECFRSIPPKSFNGITPAKVPSLTKELCAAIQPPQAPFILPATLTAFTLEQLQALLPPTFAQLSLQAIYAINPEFVPGWKDEQIIKLMGDQPTVFVAMPCAEIIKFTEEQQDLIKDTKLKQTINTFKDRYGECDGPSYGMMPGTKVLLWCGFAVLVAAAVAAIYKYMKRDTTAANRRGPYDVL